ncbi:hypothetical protein NPIL_159771 [Nephila pilipes]|uniref:Uncharacterized protein n=1 Tax=Nephila pilipes TaxID=299642 RepID=A0A8X6PTZ4_NEPPI|nr:hypothetical protein NPIL_159771 [Nephila pilipes]
MPRSPHQNKDEIPHHLASGAGCAGTAVDSCRRATGEPKLASEVAESILVLLVALDEDLKHSRLGKLVLQEQRYRENSSFVTKFIAAETFFFSVQVFLLFFISEKWISHLDIDYDEKVDFSGSMTL